MGEIKESRKKIIEFNAHYLIEVVFSIQEKVSETR